MTVALATVISNICLGRSGSGSCSLQLAAEVEVELEVVAAAAVLLPDGAQTADKEF